MRFLASRPHYFPLRVFCFLGPLLTVGYLLLALAPSGPAPAQPPDSSASPKLTAATEPKLLAAYGRLPRAFQRGLPLTFEANRGQTDPQVKFLSRGRGYTLFLTATEAVLTLRSSKLENRNSIGSVQPTGFRPWEVPLRPLCPLWFA